MDFRGLIEAAAKIRLVRDETRWTRWARYSGRQDRRMEWEGLVGSVVYAGDLAPFWPYRRESISVRVWSSATTRRGKK